MSTTRFHVTVTPEAGAYLYISLDVSSMSEPVARKLTEILKTIEGTTVVALSHSERAINIIVNGVKDVGVVGAEIIKTSIDFLGKR